MTNRLWLLRYSLVLSVLLSVPVSLVAQGAPTIDEIQRAFRNPPDDSRIMMRWWWFGPSATKEEVASELQRMKAAGIGGVELQATYPMAVDDPAHGFRNYRYLSPEFLDMLGYASQTAHDFGLRMDLTIGSGWPYGGPYIPMDLAAMRLRMDSREIAPGRTSVPRSVPYEGEHVVAAFLAHGSLGETEVDSFRQLDLSRDGPIAVPQDYGPRTLVFFVSTPTGQVVKRAAFGAEGYVLDHYNQNAIETHLREAGDKLLAAAAPGSIHSIFCDSLEVFAANWTGDLLAEFRKRRGYDLKPLLPLLEFDSGEKSTNLRRDYGRTLTELFEDRFLLPMHAWATKNHVMFRMQNYGMPPASLSSFRNVDLLEGEGFPWRKLTSTRWASSAAHLFGKPVVSSETWTWIHSPAFRATPLDLKAEADLHFLMGINQLVGHGWPYSPPQAGDPGWPFYAAGALNDKNPWWPVMPDLSRYLQRISYLLRQGTPVVDVALYAPTEDVYATLKPVSTNYTNLFERTGELIGPQAIPGILDAGFNFDLIDDGTLPEAAKLHYEAIVLAGAHIFPEATKRWLQEFARNGGAVIAVDQKPEGDWPGLEIVRQSDLSSRLSAVTAPDLKLDQAIENIGHVHRQLSDADIFFLANTSNIPYSIRARFRTQWRYAELWDPMTGKRAPTQMKDGELTLNLESYASQVVVFRSQPGPASPAKGVSLQASKDLSLGWTFTTMAKTADKSVDLPYSWSTDTNTKFFSGAATFTKNVSLSAAEAASRLYLDFGDAVPAQRESLAAHTLRGYSFAALVTPPIREAATVFVNEKRAGSLWAPPYRIEITGLVKPGKNSIRIEVYNTAINELAEGGRLANIDAVTEQYGLRFRLQDFDDLQPLPSGIVGALKLAFDH
jgi:hypothetical protein